MLGGWGPCENPSPWCSGVAAVNASCACRLNSLNKRLDVKELTQALMDHNFRVRESRGSSKRGPARSSELWALSREDGAFPGGAPRAALEWRGEIAPHRTDER